MLTPIIRRLRGFLRSNRLNKEMDAEMRFHLRMDAEKLEREGMSRTDASRQSLKDFGPMVKHVEETRDARGIRWVETLLQDARYALRTLRRSPGFAALAILTLGLGIGANTAIFSVINGVLLKPLPYANAERLVLIRQAAPRIEQDNIGVSIKELYDYREQLSSFEGLVEFHQMTFDLLRRGDPDRVAVGVVSPNFFDVLGVAPIVGRTFVVSDDDHGAEAVLVLSHAYWQTRFGGDPGIVGQVFQMNNRPHTVVGVLPAVPSYPSDVDVYMPTSACPFRAAAEGQIAQNRRAFSNLQVFGLLARGASPQTAATEVATVGERFARDFPDVYSPQESGFQARTADLLHELTVNARPLLLILIGATGLVLLIACANVANLTLARILRRDRELAMRTALGASRWRLTRQLLTESLLLTTVGSVVGLVVAWSAIDVLARLVARFTPRVGDIAIDPAVLAFTLGVSLLAGLGFGILPSLTARRVNLANALKSGGKGGGTTRVHRRIQSGLIVAQVAVAVVLLIGAGLLLHSFYRLQHVDPGFQTDRVLSAEVFGNFTKYPNSDTLRRFYVDVLSRLERAPGVVSVAMTNGVPLSGLEPNRAGFRLEGRAGDNAGMMPTSSVRIASDAYFQTLGIPVGRGRTFNRFDTGDTAPVVVINRAVERYWDGRDPIGTRISADDGRTWYTVVGIVGDVREYDLDREAVAQIYVPLLQTPFGLDGRVLVRTIGDPLLAVQTVRAAVREVDPDMPIENVRTLDEIRSAYLSPSKLVAMLLATFAGLALVVTITGIAGVIATSVTERTQEFGLRMALGATRSGVLAMVLRQGLGLVVLGLALGVGASLVLGRVLQNYLYGTTSTDPLTFVVVVLAFVVVSTLACLGPACRATTVDPMTALRAD